MDRPTLSAKNRAIVGKKAKLLRAQGELPATVYGKGLASLSISVNSEDFNLLFSKTKETGLIDLLVNNQKHPVLARVVHRHPYTQQIEGIEFYEVNLREKIKTRVPIRVVGESPMVTNNQGLLLLLLNEVEVEALPEDLPEYLTIDVSGLTDLDQELKVKQIVVPEVVAIVTDPEIQVAHLGALVSKESEKEAVAAAATSEETTPTETATPEASFTSGGNST